MPLVFASEEANEILARETGKRFDLADVDPLSGRHNLNTEPPDQDDAQGRHCTVCGQFMEGVDCWQCGGAGELDLHDEDPINFAPGTEFEDCSECHLAGGWWECASLPHEESEATGGKDT